MPNTANYNLSLAVSTSCKKELMTAECDNSPPAMTHADTHLLQRCWPISLHRSVWQITWADKQSNQCTLDDIGLHKLTKRYQWPTSTEMQNPHRTLQSLLRSQFSSLLCLETRVIKRREANMYTCIHIGRDKLPKPTCRVGHSLRSLRWKQWRRQQRGTGARAPSTSNNILSAHFGAA